MVGFVCLLSVWSFLEGKGNTTFHSSSAIAGPDPDRTPVVPFAVAVIPQPTDPCCGRPLRQRWGSPHWVRVLHVSVGKTSPTHHRGLMLGTAPPQLGGQQALMALIGATWGLPTLMPGGHFSSALGPLGPSWALPWGGGLQPHLCGVLWSWPTPCCADGLCQLHHV